jgi:hypothetical protein
MYSFQKEVLDFICASKPRVELSGLEDDPEWEVRFAIPHQGGFKIIFHVLSEQESAHLRKIENGIEVKDRLVIHLWEDYWVFQREKVQSRLLSVLGKSVRVYGRETEIVKINNNELLKFLKEHHMQVPLKAKYKYGLQYEENLLAVMSFTKGREMQRGEVVYQSYEMLRFCNKTNYTVVGGFSKLLQHFIKSEHPDDIMTYADKDWSDGHTYEKAGFKLVDMLPPMAFWLNMESGERIYGKLDKRELQAGEYRKVFNSGSLKYLKFLK